MKNVSHDLTILNSHNLPFHSRGNWTWSLWNRQVVFKTRSSSCLRDDDDFFSSAVHSCSYCETRLITFAFIFLHHHFSCICTFFFMDMFVHLIMVKINSVLFSLCSFVCCIVMLFLLMVDGCSVGTWLGNYLS